ncbi:MAG: inositol monophosphatase family protein [Thermoguttaceae bacterium]
MQQRLDWARHIAAEAGEWTLQHFYNIDHLTIERKSDASPVTIADRGAEELLRTRIAEKFPDDAICGEEFPPKEGNPKIGTNSFRWLIDPIDGTKSFIHGVPLYSTLIGIEKDGHPVAGVIALPALGEMIWAGEGLGAWQLSKHHSKIGVKPQKSEPRRIHVSTCNRIEDALFVTSEVRTFADANREAMFQKLENKARLTRTWGDAFGYFLIATGRADIMIDPILSDWDAGPLLVILQEAGGRFTDWKGHPTILGKEGIGTNGLLHDAVLEMIDCETIID